MSLALKFGNSQDRTTISGLIYLDAVTEYDKKFSGKVTSHPLDSGASISDHYFQENPKFRIKGVISSIDLSSVPSQVNIDSDTPINVNDQPTSVTVNNFHSGLSALLPASVLQFIDSTQFSVTGGTESRKNYKRDVATLLETLMRGLYFNESRKRWENRMNVMTIYEMEGIQFTHSHRNLIITDLAITEDIDNWDALNLEIELEQIRYVTLEKVDAPKTTKKGAQSTKNKGKVSTGPKQLPEVAKPNAPLPTVIGNLGSAGIGGLR